LTVFGAVGAGSCGLAPYPLPVSVPVPVPLLFAAVVPYPLLLLHAAKQRIAVAMKRVFARIWLLLRWIQRFIQRASRIVHLSTKHYFARPPFVTGRLFRKLTADARASIMRVGAVAAVSRHPPL
jgi:hypothetical protein